jgi:methyltransferase (TIGR00027 family)
VPVFVFAEVNLPLEHVSDTARWVAIYRAMETERPDALFRDLYARRLAGPRGEEIVKTMRRGKSSAWAMIVRTAVMDEIIMQTIATANVDMVINLAAGLDTRPWRLNLPSSLKWVDVDFGPILEYKRSIIDNAAPKCRYEEAHVDLRDSGEKQKLFQRLSSECTNALVVSEGLLIYLSPEDVGALARDLYAAGKFRYWLTDLASPRLLKLMKRSWGKSASAANADFRFAPEEGTAFFEKFGWKVRDVRYSLAEAQRLKREMPMAGFWRGMMRLFPKKTRLGVQQMAAVVLLVR